MVRTVVLVRHGQAKGKKYGQTDFDRELTKRGAAALEMTFPQTFARVMPTSSSELWVSTAKRALQTAEIANKTLGIRLVREFDYLYDQDYQSFMDELAISDADLVVVVGHIPFMEDACAMLTGSYMGFSTGAAACIEIDDTGKGTLVWFEDGPEV